MPSLTRPLRVLLLSYYSPPAGGPGVQRIENLLRHLPQDIEATVLAATLNDYQELPPLCVPLDEGRFQSGHLVHRVPTGAPYRLFRFLASCRLFGVVRWVSIPDTARRWAHRAVEIACLLHQQNPFDVVFSTAPPFSVALAGRNTARRLRIPWVSDLRDLWTGYLLGAWPTRYHFRREQALERSVLREATVTIMVTPGSRDWMLRRHAFLSPERITCVTNGYVASDLPSARSPVLGKLVVVHAGSLFDSGREPLLHRLVRGRAFRPRSADPSTHSLAPLFSAMKQLADPRMELRHLGSPLDDRAREILSTSSTLQRQVQVLGYRPHRETFAEVARADAAYLCLATSLDEPRNELVPQKTYEYLGSGRPVLAPIQDGDARDFLHQAGTGLLTPPYDVPSLTGSLQALLRAKLEGRPIVTPREDFIRRFEWSHLAGRMLTILDRAASRAPQATVCVG